MNVSPYKSMSHVFQKTARFGALSLMMMALVLTACSDDSLVSPEPAEDDLFTRYVSLGNSITAGFQSQGINAETQQEAYPVLLADQMGTDFNTPELNMPGCPAPLVSALPPERLEGTEDDDCEFRNTPLPRTINNVAVPGAGSIDVLDNLDEASNPSPLTTFILGGRTQIEAAEAAQPTFASVWIGNNDVLGPALEGVVEEEALTSVDDFESRLDETLDRLESAGAEGGLLIGVADVTLIPNLSEGAEYFTRREALSIDVSETCSGSEIRVPFQHGAALIQAQDGIDEAGFDETIELTCEEGETENRRTVEETLEESIETNFILNFVLNQVPEEVQSTSLLFPPEIDRLQDRVTEFNSTIESEAEARGWAFINPNPTFETLADADLIPPFPDLAEPTEIFGPIFSLDGVHPSAATHQVVANEAIEAINATYGTNLEPVDEPDLP